ncbi:methylated-DNA--[protein]-cysteine S-methyltransferase [Jatrophihabitans telluris]|uniref:Methylated-DNA--protein-cysteine methyltransferase n=1 Tax=Jatrophihabitans telluris TaxID=2038343 RepID=A0ABY4QWS9_9ACTN|nr:methylated-DNA--[protein]-cysteine S-methyltransferase [Jatrophihabitans telluris]UQX87567.1 methylated-DNA--[protein]-cysteine S-methyltransferase [Jatrophihabitans telluris]
MLSLPGHALPASTDRPETAFLLSLPSQVGPLNLAVTPVGVAALGWGTRESFGRWLALAPDPSPTAPVRALAEQATTELSEYFAGTRTRFTLPLDWRLTRRVQQIVLRCLYDTVPFGASITYGALARRSGTGVPARGIGSIMGSNPLPVIVPCHRVLSASGLGGYSGGQRPSETDTGGSSRYGLETKRWLLTFEQILPPTLGWDPAAPLLS